MSTAYRLWCVSTPPTSPVTSSSQIADWGQLTNLGPSLLVYNARVTNGSYDISVNPDVVGSLPTFVAGDAISGTGIPSGTTVVSVSGSTAVLSKDATATGTPNLTITTTSKLAVGLGLPVGIPIRIMGINAAAGIESTFALYANSGGGTTSGGCASNMNTAASDPNPVTKLGTNASPHIALQNNSDQVDEFAAGDFPSPDYVDQAIEAATTLLVESNGDFNTDPYAGAATIDGTSYSGNKVEEDSYAPATPNLLQNHYPTAMTLFNVYRTDTIRASTGGFLNWICDSNTNFSKGLDQTTGLNYDAELSTTISSVYGFPRLTDTSAAPAVATPADGEPAPNNSCAASLPVTSTINADTVSLTGGGDFPVDIVNAGGLVGGASVGIVSADFPAGTKVVSGAGTSTLTLSADATTSGSATTVFSGVPEVTTVASPQT